MVALNLPQLKRLNCQMFTCEKPDFDLLESAPVVFNTKVKINATPEKIFNAWADPNSWPVYVNEIGHVEYTSPEPYGVGTTRTVTATNGMKIEEEYMAWEENRRIAFYFKRIGMPVIASALEDYSIAELGDGECEVTWLFAIKPRGVFRIVMWLSKGTFKKNNRKAMDAFKAYVESR